MGARDHRRQHDPVDRRPSQREGRARLPNGRWLAYTSTESGRGEVYVHAFPGLGRKAAVSVDGGGAPCWSRDGREIFDTKSAKSARQVYRVSVAGTETLTFGQPELLFAVEEVSARARPRRTLPGAAPHPGTGIQTRLHVAFD